MNKYDIGNTVYLQVTFTARSSGSPVDPTNVYFRVVDPTGAENIYTFSGNQITKISIGVYALELPVNLAGYWSYRAEGMGAVFAAKEGKFFVNVSAFPDAQ